jgi:class 3 adenylate cyclase
MAACPSCRSDNAATAKFCQECGERLTERGEARRRLVTGLFCDLVGSTELAEGLDPEPLRRLLDRYHAVLREVIEAHGGVVEKFIGDAVVGVFGVPVAHEDDALRAVRAGVELVAASRRSHPERATWPGPVRVTICSGEAFVDDDAAREGRIAGDVFNTAARLQATARAGEVLMAASTERLVRRHVDATPLGRIELRGKSEPIAAFRVDGVRAMPIRAGTPLVGRERTLESLGGALAEAEAAAAAVLVTILAPPGVGKSRLGEAFAASVADRATVVVGQTPAYGEGVTFAPLIDILAQIAGRPGGDATSVAAALRERLRSQPDGSAVADRLAQMLGVREASVSDAAWAIRRLLEVLAAERPLVVIIEDLHAAEAPMLDLIDAVVDRFHGPCLLIGLARPELLELRPMWAAAKPRAMSLTLRPLDVGPARSLAQHLIGVSAPHGVVEHLCAAAEGNPLFLEQLVASLADDGLVAGGRWVGPDDIDLDLPPDLHALLAARVDRLEVGLRAILERAAVEGHRFRRSALGTLAPSMDASAIDEALATLDRRGLVSPEDEANGRWRISHALIQETAYRGLSKRVRAELHEQLADWMAVVDADRPDVDESVARQLERAIHLREELGERDAHTAALAIRAGELYADAGSRAFAAVDLVTTRELLGRAAELLPVASPRRMDILPNLGVALSETGRPGETEALLEPAIARARADGSERDAHRARIQLLSNLVYRSVSDAEVDAAVDEATAAVQAFAGWHDLVGQAEAEVTLEYLEWIRGRVGVAHAWAERALIDATAAGRPREAMQAAADLVGYSVFGPLAVGDLGPLAAGLLDRASDPVAATSGHALLAIASLAEGDHEAFAAHDGRRNEVIEHHGLAWLGAAQDLVVADVLLTAGDAVEAERLLVDAHDVLAALGDIWWMVQVDSFLASALTAQGRRREFLQRADMIDASTFVPDRQSRILQDRIRSRAALLRGDPVDAERLARRAVERALATDLVLERAASWLDLADALEARDQPTDAGAARTEAREEYRSKGMLAAAGRIAG